MLFGLNDAASLDFGPPALPVHAAQHADPIPVLLPSRRPIPVSRVFTDFRDAREYMHTAGGAMKTAGGGRRYACVDDACDAKCAVNACSGGFSLTWSRDQGHLVSCTALEKAPAHMQHSQVKILTASFIIKSCLVLYKKVFDLLKNFDLLKKKNAKAVPELLVPNRSFIAPTLR